MAAIRSDDVLMVDDEPLYNTLVTWEAAVPSHKLAVLGYWRQQLKENSWQQAVLSLVRRLPANTKLALVCPARAVSAAC